MTSETGRENAVMAQFVDAAREWTAAMRASLESRDLARLDGLVSGYDSLEKRARILAARLRGRGDLAEAERERYLNVLRELSRAAHVVAALSESEALYLRWGQTSARPVQGYTSSGEAATAASPQARWEA